MPPVVCQNQTALLTLNANFEDLPVDRIFMFQVNTE